MTEQKLTLPITGMTCANCAANIERVVKKLDGVTEANVNFAAESAAVTFDPRQLQLQDVVEKIHKSGFGVTTAKVEMPVTGMTCANCAANIERALNKKTSGVVNAAVNFASERVSATFWFSTGMVKLIKLSSSTEDRNCTACDKALNTDDMVKGLVLYRLPRSV